MYVLHCSYNFITYDHTIRSQEMTVFAECLTRTLCVTLMQLEAAEARTVRGIDAGLRQP
jgi:hypothetical protein